MIFILIIVAIILYFIITSNSEKRENLIISNDYQQLNSEQKLILELTEIFHKASVEFPPTDIPEEVRGLFSVTAINSCKKSMVDNAEGFSREYRVSLFRVYEIIEICYNNAINKFYK